MGYYVRVFCKSEAVPSFKELEEYMLSRNKGYNLNGTVDDNNNSWTDFELHYKEGKLPLLVELNWTNEEGSIGAEEVEEFLEEIGSPGFSITKWKVVQHLKQTKYIVCSQLPTSDIADDGYNANSELLNFFVENYQGMIHADGEGFYIKNQLVLKDL